MRVLLVGAGGREHALAWKLVQSPLLTELHAAPGNPGIAALGQCHPVRADDNEAVLGLARALQVDLVVVGPEVPLVAGLADLLRSDGHPGVRPLARRGGDRGLEDVREGGHGRRGRAHRGDTRRAGGTVRAQGRRSRRRQGSRRLPDGGRGRRPGSPSSTGSQARSSSRSCSRAPRCRCSRSATASRRTRCRSRRTSSAPRTATGARTPAGWGRSPRFPASASTRSRSWSTSRAALSWPSSRPGAARSSGRCSRG